MIPLIKMKVRRNLRSLKKFGILGSETMCALEGKTIYVQRSCQMYDGDMLYVSRYPSIVWHWLESWLEPPTQFTNEEVI